MRVYGITGMPGAGKSVAAEVAKEIDIPVARMGDAVWDEVLSRGLSLGEENVARVSDEMRRSHHAAVWAERTTEKVMKLAAKVVVIDGVRSMDEVDYFRRRLGRDFTLVAITAPLEIRMERIFARGRADETRDPERFLARDRRETEWGLAKVIETADVKLENAGDVEAFKRRIRELFQSS